MGKRISIDTAKILLLILLIAGVMGFGLYAQRHTSEAEGVEEEITETTEIETTEIETTEIETTETAETETTASPSGDAVAVETEENQNNKDIIPKKQLKWLKHKYIYSETRYLSDSVLEIYYPEVLFLKDQELQNQVNAAFRKLALNAGISEYIENLKYWDMQEKWQGQSEKERELARAEERRKPIKVYFTHQDTAFLYGTILSTLEDKTKEWEAYYALEDWDAYQAETWYTYGSDSFGFYHVVDVSNMRELALDDIMSVEKNFFEILENVDFSLYMQESDVENAVKGYEEFFQNFSEDTPGMNRFVENKDDDWHWYLDEQGRLHIYDSPWETFNIPLNLFSDILKPEYQWLAEDGIIGQEIELKGKDSEAQENVMDKSLEGEETNEDYTFQPVHYEYSEDLKLDFFQIDGMQDACLQRDMNDEILSDVLNSALDELSYAYKNNQYYDEEEVSGRTSRVQVTSDISHHYLNGRILSFINIKEVQRKAYTRSDGVKVESNCKGPYLQAFNIDCMTGKELLFDDVFQRDISASFQDRLNNFYWNRDIESKNAESPAFGILFYMSLGDMAEREHNSEQTRRYHWYVNEEQNLCFYIYDIQENENQSAKLPLATEKENVKPEYQSCFHFD